MLICSSLFGIAIALIWVYLVFGHGSFWLPLLPRKAVSRTQMPSIDIIVPARNEAEVLPQTLPSLLDQAYAGEWKIILVDDHSSDNTAPLARTLAQEKSKSDRLVVIKAPNLPEGWSGKVSAMNAGVLHSRADMLLFTDADILHPQDSLEKLAALAEEDQLDLVSRMVRLTISRFAEKLLVPAFVYFFGMLYPFRRANDPASAIAAAAGGVMLVRREALDKAGGLSTIKSALIDDCSLAKVLKKSGARIQITLSTDIQSLRTYPKIADVWKMIARTAYTQLRLCPLLLVGTVAGLLALFLAPILLLSCPNGSAAFWGGIVSLALMIGSYIPMVLFYGLKWTWALTLPLAALIYVAATIDSARLYHQGKGGQWKGRAQA